MKKNKTKLKRKSSIGLDSRRAQASRTKQRNKPLRRARKRSVTSRKTIQRPKKDKPAAKIVRIMGHGQLSVNWRTLRKLKQIDNVLVELVRKERSDDIQFRQKLAELSAVTTSNGKPLSPTEIVKSDIIIPSPDLGLEEAKKLFKGDGVIPAI